MWGATMSRARKPGTPGKTTIPQDVVEATAGRLMKAFAENGAAIGADLSVTAQQEYLYLETVERPAQDASGIGKPRYGKARGPRRRPLGRMVWTGQTERWELQAYLWAEECWDTKNKLGSYGGTPEECMIEATL